MLRVKGYRDINSSLHIRVPDFQHKGVISDDNTISLTQYSKLSRFNADNSSVNKSDEIERKDKKKNAIFMMCIVNEHYVIGACIAAYCHRRMLMRAGLKNAVDLCIMCDDKIYQKYHQLLEDPVLFDVVLNIEIRMFPDAKHYNYSKVKYSSWIGASLNKWQIMNHDEYHRIMFVDVALLPVSPKFYDLFNIPVPALLVREKLLQETDRNTYKCTDGEYIRYQRSVNVSYDQYLENEATYGTIHGNLVVIEPDKELYTEYVKMTDQIFESGIHSIYKSGPDETSLFYFFLKQGIMVHSICHENATIPWDEQILIDISKGYEFSSMFKPWTKPKILCWPEEILWRDVYDILIKHVVKTDSRNYAILNDLFKRTILDTYHRYVESDQRTRHKNYNDKFVTKMKKEFDHLDSIESEQDDDTLFDALMKLDSKIYVKYYGPLKTRALTDSL